MDVALGAAVFGGAAVIGFVVAGVVAYGVYELLDAEHNP